MDKPSIDTILADAVSFIARLSIRDKSGKTVCFGDVITPEQITLIEALQSHKKVLIIKARQLGISTLVRAFCFWEAYVSKSAINSVVVSNKEKSAKALLEIDKRFYDTLPKPLRRYKTIDTTTHVQFGATKTNLMAMTAKANGQDRGYSLNTAHLSEFAFYDNADVYLASLLASTNDGRVIIESTPNYYGDALHELVKAHMYDDASPWHVVFMPWSVFPEYRLSAEDLELTDEELTLMGKYALDKEQIAWRRNKIKEMKSVMLFQREYPLTIEEAWTLSDNCYFTEENLEHLVKLNLTDKPSREILKEDKFVIGVDPAGGVGRDFSVATVISKLDNNPIAKISSNKTSISAFANDVVALAKKFNNALIHFEENNHGHAFRECLNHIGYNNYKPFNTNVKSKITLLEKLKDYLTSGLCSYVDEKALYELKMLQKSSNTTAPSHPPGAHDDHVISLALAVDALSDIPSIQSPHDVFLRQMAQQKPPSHRPMPGLTSNRRLPFRR